MASAAIVAVTVHVPTAAAVNVVPAIVQLPGLVVTLKVNAPVPEPPLVLSVDVPR